MTEEERGVFDRALSLLRALVSDLDRRFLEFQETEALAAELRPALIRLGRDLRRAVQVAIKESRDYSAFSEVNETGQLLLKEVNTLDSFLRMPLVLSKVSKEVMWLTSRVASIDRQERELAARELAASHPEEPARDPDALLGMLDDEQLEIVAGWLAEKGVEMGL